VLLIQGCGRVGMSKASSTPEALGGSLQVAIGQVLEQVPGCTLRPTDLSRKLGVSRAIVSRAISAVKKESPIETLTSIPGPESLRTIILAASVAGVCEEEVQAAIEAIDSFAEMIREQFGTRTAFNAALSVDHDDAREKFEQANRYKVYKGMTHILGVECKLWLSCTIRMPGDHIEGCEDLVCMTTVSGPSGLRRLRPDMPIYLNHCRPVKHKHGSQDPMIAKPVDIKEFYTHPPAELINSEFNGQTVNTFNPDIQGKKDYYDMFDGVTVHVSDYHKSKPDFSFRGTSTMPDPPAMSLVIDSINHRDVLAGIKPELYVYRTLGRGLAKLKDPARDRDLVVVDEEIVDCGMGISKLALAEFPLYTDMIEHICEQRGFHPDEFQVHRIHVPYPVYGFQYLIAYRLRDAERSRIDLNQERVE